MSNELEESARPKLVRTPTLIMREYLLNKIPRNSLTDKETEIIVKDLKRAQRVDPLVDIASHGLPTVASQLRHTGILTVEDDNAIYKVIDQIKTSLNRKRSSERHNLRLLFINATELGGGVAEMRPNNSRFMQEFGIQADWAVIDGCPDFYRSTVHIHEGIQNPSYKPLTAKDFDILQLVTANNFARFENLGIFEDCDAVWIDDPQPLAMLPLIRARHPKLPILWRCHVHCDPEPSIREYISSIVDGIFKPERDKIIHGFMLDKYNIDLTVLKPKALQAKAAIFHRNEFAEGLNLSVPIIIMGPAIDPLSYKNLPVSQDFIKATLAHYGIASGNATDEAQQMNSKTSLQSPSPHPKTSLLNQQIPPIVLEVSRYDPYKGPIEVLVSFIEAMKKLDPSNGKEKELMENCRFVFAASTPGDNPSGKELFEMMKDFLERVPVSESGPLEGLRERVFLLSLKDQRRTEVLQKILVDEIWECIRHREELMIRDVLIRNHSLPLEGLIEQLESKQNPFITKEMGDFLRKKGEELVKANVCAYFTREQTETAAGFVKETAFLDISNWIKISNNLLGGKEMNHLEVNAMQTAAVVRCQFSSKEGFGLVVAEAMVKEQPCDPPIYGVTVATTVGGIKSQVLEDIGIPIQYPINEVRKSLKMYQELSPENMKNPSKVAELYKEIANRKSVKDFSSAIVQSLKMPSSSRKRMSEKARKHILSNFAIHSNVLNILKAIAKVLEME